MNRDEYVTYRDRRRANGRLFLLRLAIYIAYVLILIIWIWITKT